MKKIFLFSLMSAFCFNAFAFQGVIEQTYTDAKTLEQKTFVWSINGEKVRLDIKSGEETVTILPDFQKASINLYANKADDQGVYWYSNTAVSQISVNVPKLRVLETTSSDYKGEAAKEIKLMSSNGLVVVQYLPNIDINMKHFIMVFAESMEFNAVSLANDAGFPVSSMLVNESNAINTLTTNSITEKSIDASTFQVPANYKLFTGIK